MGERKGNLLFKFARMRLIVSRVFAILVVFVLLFTESPLGRGTLPDILCGLFGLFLLSLCSTGRLWALLYISGRKTQEVITEGPYSIVRHPLYLFSFIGAIGTGLVSENMLVMALLIIFYLSYYPLTVLSEEKTLTDKFGQAYIDYMKNTPRFMPKLSLYKSPQQFMVNGGIFLRNLAEGMWFIWIFIFLQVVKALQLNGLLPILFQVPYLTGKWPG